MTRTHCEPPPPPLDPGQFLRDGCANPVDFAGIWAGLRSGRLRFAQLFHTDDRCCALLSECEPPAARGTREDRDISILEQILLGHAQKVVAGDLRVSLSTVATAAARVLTRMGCGSRGSNPPVLLAIIVHAARSGRTVPDARLVRFFEEGPATWLLSTPRPELGLGAGLSDSEGAVLRHLVDGQTLPEIARGRRTSPRTVANQLGAVFRKLGISGRSAALGLLASRAGVGVSPN